MARPRWDSVSVFLGPGTPALEGDLWLAALFRWLRQETPAWVLVTSAAGEALYEPMGVNWDQFPLERALEAVRALRPQVRRLIEVVRQEPPPRPHSPVSIARILSTREPSEMVESTACRGDEAWAGPRSSRRGGAGVKR
ncbi:hypothetical protein [Chondromyces crocatus]|uniref:Uncharacterized protein n=1 Tax=Chondromyces crocatus TaxID=52 RepID=A0A0K1EN01_CHOCO|nr:hypothetical protein [Chondromyces crocatus]AKT42008.1 uncharacterized protein CMC5_062300 [Chondromyces crocatus]